MDLYKSYKSELLNSIPIISGMDVDIVNIENRSITATAPLNTNINYEGTAFGGSLNTLCVLSAYLLVHHTLKQNNVEFSSLVIQDSSIKYLKPVDRDFKARSSIFEKDEKLLFKLIDKKGVGRISVTSEVTTQDNEEEPRVIFRGRFVVSR